MVLPEEMAFVVYYEFIKKNVHYICQNYIDNTGFCSVFFYFRKFVSLHRIQTHTGGIQDFHRGETHHTSAHRKSDMFICKSKLSRSMIKRSNLFSPQRHIMFPLICRVIYFIEIVLAISAVERSAFSLI